MYPGSLIRRNQKWDILENHEKTDKKTIYKCSQERCPYKAVISLSEADGEVFYFATIIDNHSSRNFSTPKPLHSHLVAAVAKASAYNKNIIEALATEFGLAINQRTISRIKKEEVLDGAWESLWRKLPAFVDELNANKTIASYTKDNDGNLKLLFMALPYTQRFANSQAFL